MKKEEQKIIKYLTAILFNASEFLTLTLEERAKEGSPIPLSGKNINYSLSIFSSPSRFICSF
jgi:hypothetical protein